MGTHTLLNKKTIALSIALAITGCGGGGGGTPASGPTPEDSSVKGVTFNGAAAKGIIKNGHVTAIEVDTSGAEIRTVGSAVTAADGTYEINLSDDYEGGPIKVTVNKSPDTEMKCDVPAGCGMRTDNIPDDNGIVNFGEWYKPGSLTLSALVPAATENAKIKVNVTPYTHLAAQQVISQNSFTAEAIANTNSEITNLIGGIDILNTPPLDITDPNALGNSTSDQKAYAALSSAIASLADVNDNGEPDIDSALEKLASSYSTGTFAADDSDAENDDEIFSLQEIIDATNETFNEIGISDTSTRIASLETSIKNAIDLDGDGTKDLDPQPSPNAGDTNLAKVKAMVTDIRTWGYVMKDELEEPGSAFGDQIELASDSIRLVRNHGLYQSDLGPLNSGMIIDIIHHYLFEGGSSDLTDYAYAYRRNLWESPVPLSSGTISMSEPGKVVITNAQFDYTVFNGTFVIPKDGAVGNSFSIGVTKLEIKDFVGTTEITNGLLTLNLANTYTIDWDGIGNRAALPPNIDSVRAEMDASFTLLLDAATTIQNQMNGQSGTEAFAYFPDPITLSGHFDTLILTDTVVNETTGELELNWAMPSTLKINGSINNTTGDSVNGSFTMNIQNADTFRPIGSAYESDNNWLDIDASLSFDAQLADLPGASVTLTGDRTDFQAGKVDIKLAYGTRSVTIAAAGQTDGEKATLSSDITITNQDGVVLILAPGSQANTGTISLNGIQYATVIETSSGEIKIEYIDNSFETLL